jgi:hypothetical protein
MENTQQTATRYVCRHIHTSGNRCNSPSLRNEDFCYHHHFTRRQPPSETYVPCDAAFDLPALLDRLSIQLALSELARRLAQNQIDYDRVKLLLRTLRIASINLPKEPRNAEPVEILQVEEYEIDPIQGPIAPIAEVPTPEERKSWAQRFYERLLCEREAAEREAAEREAKEAAEAELTQESEEPEPPTGEIIPEIQAVAQPHPAWRPAIGVRPGRHSAGRAGWRQSARG